MIPSFFDIRQQIWVAPMSDKVEFETRVCEVIERFDMLKDGAHVVVAVSGGPDSMALLYCLNSLRSRFNIQLTAAHFEHGIRGEESALDADYVVAQCKDLGLPLHLEYGNIPAAVEVTGESITIAARRLRHSFLRRVAYSGGANDMARIALGHNRDDRAETILMNVLRGTGIDGLAALPPVRLPLIRPLIEISRSDIEAYLLETGIKPRRDSSNQKWDYLRNRVRGELLPLIEASYYPAAREAILRLSNLASDDSAALNALAAEALEEISTRTSSAEVGSSIHLDANQLVGKPIALRRRIVRLAIAAVRGSLDDVDASSVDAIALGAGHDPGSRLLRAVDGITINARWNAEWVMIEPTIAADAQPEGTGYEYSLSVPGELILQESDVAITARIHQAVELVTERQEFPRKPALVFKMSDIGNNLVVRQWRHGDKFKQKGVSGTKKLQDLYTDCKVPSSARWRYPVLAVRADSETILAVLNLRPSSLALDSNTVAEIAACNPQTPVVVVSVLRLSELA